MSVQDVKALRERTGAGMIDCKKALAENGGDIEKAIDWLRAKGIAKAAKKASRAATEGVVEAYIHGNGSIGVLVEVNCETDFVAINAEFKALVRDIAMQIAASSPEFVNVEDVDPAAAERERQVQLERVMEEGKPRAVAEKIVEGRMKKWLSEVVLMEQEFFKDDKKTIRQLIENAIATMGENIKIRRFSRFVLGEGLEKKADNFAEEVAKMTSGQA
jgi:elongation factor Ts